MSKTKLLLYCTRSKPNLVKRNIFAGVEPAYFTLKESVDDKLNGKIVAECDYEVEEISSVKSWNSTEDYDWEYETPTLCYYDLLRKSCLMCDEFEEYIEFNGYAIHIKNLHIFDKPKELSDYFTEKSYNDIDKIFTDEIMMDRKWYRPVNKAPQNMMRVKRVLQEDAILISIRPEWLCKILNKEKTIEVRKVVLKEMIGNE